MKKFIRPILVASLLLTQVAPMTLYAADFADLIVTNSFVNCGENKICLDSDDSSDTSLMPGDKVRIETEIRNVGSIDPTDALIEESLPQGLCLEDPISSPVGTSVEYSINGGSSWFSDLALAVDKCAIDRFRVNLGSELERSGGVDSETESADFVGSGDNITHQLGPVEEYEPNSRTIDKLVLERKELFEQVLALTEADDSWGSPLFVDIDGDGKDDIVVSRRGAGAGNSRVYRNTSTPGNFSVDPVYVFGGTDAGIQSDMVYEDVDGDGKSDLIMAGKSGRSSIYRNTSSSGTIMFDDGYRIPGGTNTFSNVIYEDVDGDGKKDLIMGSSNGVASKVVKNNSTPGNLDFVDAGISFVQGSRGTDPVYFDIDGDGLKDLVFGSNNFENVSGTHIYKNTSISGTVDFDAGITLTPVADAFSTPQFADFDGDGLQDLLVTGLLGTSYVYLNTSSLGTISFANGVNLPVADVDVANAIVYDFNDDDRLDIALPGKNGTSSAFRNTSTEGAISFDSAVSLGAVDPLGYFSYSHPAMDDINDDGKMDLIMNGYYAAYLINTSNPTTLSFLEKPFEGSGFASYYGPVMLHDFTDDGVNEIFLTKYYTTTYYYNYSLSGSAKVSTATGNLSTGVANQSVPLPADVDGDGLDDLIIASTPNSAPSNIYRNTGRSYQTEGYYITSLIVPSGATDLDRLVIDSLVPEDSSAQVTLCTGGIAGVGVCADGAPALVYTGDLSPAVDLSGYSGADLSDGQTIYLRLDFSTEESDVTPEVNDMFLSWFTEDSPLTFSYELVYGDELFSESAVTVVVSSSTTDDEITLNNNGSELGFVLGVSADAGDDEEEEGEEQGSSNGEYELPQTGKNLIGFILLAAVCLSASFFDHKRKSF